MSSSNLLPKWQLALVVGAPVAIGLSYMYYRNKNSNDSKISDNRKRKDALSSKLFSIDNESTNKSQVRIDRWTRGVVRGSLPGSLKTKMQGRNVIGICPIAFLNYRERRNDISLSVKLILSFNHFVVIVEWWLCFMKVHSSFTEQLRHKMKESDRETATYCNARHYCISKSSFLKLTQRFVIQKKYNGIMIGIHQKVSHGSMALVHGVITCNASEQNSVPVRFHIPDLRFIIPKGNSRIDFYSYLFFRTNDFFVILQLYIIDYINYNCIIHIVKYIYVYSLLYMYL